MFDWQRFEFAALRLSLRYSRRRQKPPGTKITCFWSLNISLLGDATGCSDQRKARGVAAIVFNAKIN